jgi:hypothetical protein
MIEVRNGRLGKSVHATDVIEAGQVIFNERAERVPRRTRHSFQVDHDTHVEIHAPIELINHSCEPNCGVLVRREVPAIEIHALRRLEPGEELTTDYCAFEYEIEFMCELCLCDAPSCRGRITGYRDLPDAVKASFGPYVAEYLREIDAPVGQPR